MKSLLYLSPLLIIGLLSNYCSYTSPKQISENSSSYLNDSIMEELETRIDNKSKFDCDLLRNNPPGDTPVIFGPGKISIGRENGAITFSPNGNELWFARVFPYEIYYMEKINGKWSGPKAAPFSGKHKDLYPFLSPDGKKLFFASNRSLKKNSKGKMKKHSQIWECRKMQAGWTEPRNIGSVVNFGMYHICPTISSKGTLFYNLAINNKDSSDLDIYESKYIYNNFTKPQSLGLSINSASLDYSPYIARDESYIIFASKRHGYGMSDLFISYKKSNGSWTEAINMGATINTKDNESFPSVSPDGKYLFFNSTRCTTSHYSEKPKKFSHIYWVSADIIEKLKPNYLKKIRSEKEKNL